MKTDDLIAIDTHTHLEVSCRNPFDSYGEEFDRAADKYFRSSRRPTMQETIDFRLSVGSESVGNTPEEFAAFLDAEREKWGSVIKKLDLKLD